VATATGMLVAVALTRPVSTQAPARPAGADYTGMAFNFVKIDHFEAYLRDFWMQAQQMHKNGVAPHEAAKRIDMRSHAGNYPTITQAGVNVAGVYRAYEFLDGKAQ